MKRHEPGRPLRRDNRQLAAFCLTKGKSYKTDYSNAPRTQLFNVFSLKWDEEICGLFGIRPDILPEVCDSDAYFGNTDFEGYLPNPVPVHSVLGTRTELCWDRVSESRMTKATYGTGSSIMMNIGERPILSTHGLGLRLPGKWVDGYLMCWRVT